MPGPERAALAQARELCDDSPVEQRSSQKQFHGWRLAGVLALVIIVLAALSFVVDWMVIGPLAGRLL